MCHSQSVNHRPRPPPCHIHKCPTLVLKLIGRLWQALQVKRLKSLAPLRKPPAKVSLLPSSTRALQRCQRTDKARSKAMEVPLDPPLCHAHSRRHHRATRSRLGRKQEQVLNWHAGLRTTLLTTTSNSFRLSNQSVPMSQ